MNNEYCVCCGAVIPEGRHVCLDCEPKVKEAFLLCADSSNNAPCSTCPLYEKCSKISDEETSRILSGETSGKERKRMSMYIFPIALIVLNIGAAVMCFCGKDYKKAVYWLAAAVLNISVTI